MTRTIREISTREAEFLSRLAARGQTIFSTGQAEAFWGNARHAANVLSRLVEKGWLQRLERGVYMILPLEAGPERAWSESALVIACRGDLSHPPLSRDRIVENEHFFVQNRGDPDFFATRSFRMR